MSSLRGGYSHYHQQNTQPPRRVSGLTIIIDNQAIIMIINRTNRFIIIIPFITIKIFSLSSMAGANRQSLLKSPLTDEDRKRSYALVKEQGVIFLCSTE